MSRPALRALTIGDPPERWEALGFAVRSGLCTVGGVTISCDAAHGPGIRGWAVTGVPWAAIDGLHEASPPPAAPDVEHPNGALAVDHVVVTTPAFDRTAAALAAAGMELRRIREVAGGPDTDPARPRFRQGFRRLGPAILEVVEQVGAADGPARFWGLVVNVADLDALSVSLGPLLKPIRPAVQPGRRIATLHRDADLSCAVAFMDPEPTISTTPGSTPR